MDKSVRLMDLEAEIPVTEHETAIEFFRFFVNGPEMFRAQMRGEAIGRTGQRQSQFHLIELVSQLPFVEKSPFLHLPLLKKGGIESLPL